MSVRQCECNCSDGVITECIGELFVLLQWLEEDFLQCLSSWDDSVSALPGVTTAQKQAMTLSRETKEGLKMTGTLMTICHWVGIITVVMLNHYHFFIVHSFVDVTRYILMEHSEDNLFILSERFSQDSLENYFGQQRARGGRSDNPTVQRSLHNACALRVQKSMALDPVRGNSRRKRRLFDGKAELTLNDVNNTPLPK